MITFPLTVYYINLPALASKEWSQDIASHFYCELSTIKAFTKSIIFDLYANGTVIIDTIQLSHEF